MNPHYQNLLDDRKAMSEAYSSFEFGEPISKMNHDRLLAFLTDRRLIEWKKNVERWNIKKEVEKDLRPTGWTTVCDSELDLLQEAIALTEAEK